MKKLLSALLPALALMFTMGAANAANVKIGVIDLHQILQKAPQVKVINKKLESQFKPRQAKIVALQKTIKNGMAKFSKDGSVMSASQKTAMQEKIMKQRRDLARMEQDYQQDLGVAQNQSMQQFFAKLKGIVSTVAKKGDYDLILQKDGVPYANPTVDVTSQVLKQLA